MWRNDPLVSNFPINDDFEIEFWMVGVTRVDLDRRPTSSRLSIVVKIKFRTTVEDAPFIVPDR